MSTTDSQASLNKNASPYNGATIPSSLSEFTLEPLNSTVIDQPCCDSLLLDSCLRYQSDTDHVIFVPAKIQRLSTAHTKNKVFHPPPLPGRSHRDHLHPSEFRDYPHRQG